MPAKMGMGIAVTTPSALEEYEQIEVLSGLVGPIYGPVNPSGMLNFVTRPSNRAKVGSSRVGIRRLYCRYHSYRPGVNPKTETLGC